MNLATIIYLAGLSGNIGTVLFTVGSIGLVAILFGLLMSVFMALEAYDDKASGIRKWSFVQLRWIAPALVLAVFFPTEQRVYMMVAADVSADAFNTPEAEKLRRLINEKLDEALQ